MRRAFGIAVLACPRCGGRLRLIVTLEDPAVVGEILAPCGAGKFKGISGVGKYKGHFPSVMDVVNDWDGEYTLA